MAVPTAAAPLDFERRLKQYEHARANALWRPERDIDWDRPSPISDDLKEVACYLAWCGTYTEEIGMLTCARLLMALDDVPGRYCLAMQTADEARHSEAFTRYVHRVQGDPPPPPEGVSQIMNDLEAIENPTALFVVHTLLEGFAFDQFSFIEPAFAGDPLADIYGYVRRDEARHVAMGIDYLSFALRRDTSDEVIDTLNWCKANVFTIGHITPEFIDWLVKITGKPSSDICKTFKARHEARLQQIWKEVNTYEET